MIWCNNYGRIQMVHIKLEGGLILKKYGGTCVRYMYKVTIVNCILKL